MTTRKRGLRIQSDHPCECGCGQFTLISDRTYRRYGYELGKPLRFVRGHYSHKRMGTYQDAVPAPFSPIEASAYLAGIIDGEGWVGHRRAHRTVQITNTDMSILDATREALMTLGIEWKERSHSKCPGAVVITITQRANLERLAATVTLRSTKKRVALGEALASYVDWDHYLIVGSRRGRAERNATPAAHDR